MTPDAVLNVDVNSTVYAWRAGQVGQIRYRIAVRGRCKQGSSCITGLRIAWSHVGTPGGTLCGSLQIRKDALNLSFCTLGPEKKSKLLESNCRYTSKHSRKSPLFSNVE